MKKMLFLFICTLFLSFTNKNHIILAHKIMEDFIAKIEQEGFVCEACGGSMPDDIKTFRIQFACHERKNLEEARKVFIDLAEQFLREANSCSTIRPYLHNYPALCRNLSLMLHFMDEENQDYLDGSITCVFNYKDRIVYYNSSVDESRNEVWDESYEDALHIVLGK